MVEAYTIGSCCSGFGGLERAVEAVLGPARHLWHAEFNPEKSKILKAHWPDVPNLGDLSKVDWTQVERPDVLTAGFPCTDISAAGRRAGMGAGTRSGVWAHIAEAISVLRPQLVLVENVRALLSTHAQRNDGTDSDLESATADLGTWTDRPVLRALGAVLGDLADLGFDAEWTTVAASDVGAPHRRQRVFLIAWPADSEGIGQWHLRPQGQSGIQAAAVAGGAGTDDLRLLPTPGARLGDERGSPSPTLAADRMASGRRNLDDAVALLPTPTARDGDGRGEGSPEYWASRQGRENGQRAPLGAVINLLPTPMAADGGWGRGSSAGFGLRNESRAVSTGWGRYAEAIARWERITGRPVPEPTEPGAKGQPRLSARFVEWMQGLPDGWVTDHVARNPALHALGDGVVWQQGAHALRLLLSSAANAQIGDAA